MRKLIQLSTLLAAGLALAAQGQSSSSGTTGQSGSSSSDPNSSSSSSPGSASSQNQGAGIGSSQQSQRYSHYSATGRSGQHEARASKIIGSDLKASEGSSLGKIEDVLFNPT